MGPNGRNRAVQLLRDAFRVAALPFRWPAAALRRSRESTGERGQSAERARFDTRKWTPELLKHLEWRRFEELCAAYYEALGSRTRLSHSRPDGGVEILLCAQGSESASSVVHCKAWDAYRVGVKPLQELRRAMVAAGARKGVLVTSGRFTREAVTFAAREEIQLIDGAGLLARLTALEPDKSAALLQFTTQGDFLTPTCPRCSVKMTARKSIQGGRTYWGCVNYPRCKHTVSAT
jgi:restriction system protein